MSTSLTQSAIWQELGHHQAEVKAIPLRDLVMNDPRRLEDFQLSLEGLRFNFALNRIVPKTIDLLTQLAAQQKLEFARERMFCGEVINISEGRAALHTALRQKKDRPIKVDGRDIIPDILIARLRLTRFVDEVRNGYWKGASGEAIRHIVNIGIGGSDLGPRLATRALSPFISKLNVHFVANADAFELTNILANIDPAHTLFVVVSKTFTTQETLLNAHMARQWLVNKLGPQAVAQHFVAVSANQAEVEKFGIDVANVFPIWDWVGGRYSLWSAVGLSLALAIGMENFEKMLDGAEAMDEHFCTAPLAKNMPVVMGLLGVWYRNFWATKAQVILPYAERLRDLPRYLQQLEMESNGKTTTQTNQRVDYATAPIIFGECGTVGQHSFHQLLHQGSDVIPADFIGICEDNLNKPQHHQAMLANMVAQAGALAFGRDNATDLHNACAGNRPSNLILLDRLDPFCFGMLLALYEHKVFVEGVVWNINSFDQPGVELGKELARGLEAKEAANTSEKVFLTRLFKTVQTPNIN